MVASPGRLDDLVARRDIELDDVDIVVLDEADRMADMGFLPAVGRILDATRPTRQTLLFSATLDGDVDVLIRRYQRDPAATTSPSPTTAPTCAIRSGRARQERVGLTAGLVHRHGRAIVFCRTRHGADRLARQLRTRGVTAVAIHGNRTQAQRQRALDDFAAGRAQALVATDVAARGIHVDAVACVVHFDPPADAKDYVHRSGRTGRAGATGTVVTLVAEDQRQAVATMRRTLGLGDTIERRAGAPRPRPKPRPASPGRRRGPRRPRR